MPKSFDARYFDKWYRDPVHKIGTRTDLERLVTFAVAAAEYVLARRVRTVLDIGAGEGRWAPVLHRLRPHATYYGIEPSSYAVSRFGKRRNLFRGGVEDIAALFPDRRFDLVVCCSVLNYLPRVSVEHALPAIARATGGLAYLEIFTSSDDVRGDLRGWHAENPAWYRKTLSRAGFTRCGLHCYVPRTDSSELVALERA